MPPSPFLNFSLLPNRVLWGLAGLEHRRFGSRDLDFLPGLRIAPHLLCLLLDRETHEACQLHLVSSFQCLLNLI